MYDDKINLVFHLTKKDLIYSSRGVTGPNITLMDTRLSRFEREMASLVQIRIRGRTYVLKDRKGVLDYQNPPAYRRGQILYEPRPGFWWRYKIVAAGYVRYVVTKQAVKEPTPSAPSLGYLYEKPGNRYFSRIDFECKNFSQSPWDPGMGA